MNTLKIFLLHSFVFFIVACGHNTKQTTEPNIVLNIDFPKEERHINLSELVDSISFIRLQTNDSCRIGSIDKLIVAENFFLIVDKSLASSILLFDTNGKFINSIGSRGRSQKEYISIEDVTIGDGKIFVLDSKGNKIISYSIEGEYLEYFSFDMTAFFFKHIEGKRFAFSCEYSKNYELVQNGMLPNFLIYDFETKQIVKSDMYFNSEVSNAAYPVSLNNLSPYMYQIFSNDIYKVSKDGLIPFFHMNYPSKYKKNMEEYNKMVSQNRITINESEKVMKAKPFPKLITFFDCGNMFFSFIVNETKLYYNFYYHIENRLIQAVSSKGIPLEDDIYNSLVVIPQASFKGNLFYAENIDNISNIEGLSEMHDEDNPVIVKLYMKKR